MNHLLVSLWVLSWWESWYCRPQTLQVRVPFIICPLTVSHERSSPRACYFSGNGSLRLINRDFAALSLTPHRQFRAKNKYLIKNRTPHLSIRIPFMFYVPDVNIQIVFYYHIFQCPFSSAFSPSIHFPFIIRLESTFFAWSEVLFLPHVSHHPFPSPFIWHSNLILLL